MYISKLFLALFAGLLFYTNISLAIPFKTNNLDNPIDVSSSPIWSYVGQPDLAKEVTGTIYDYNMAVAPDGTPYLALTASLSGSFQLTVLRYDINTNTWQPVSAQRIVAQDATSIDLTISPSGIPYVAYLTEDHTIMVMKYDSISQRWISVGNTGALASFSYSSIKIAVNQSEIPYVVYTDYQWGSSGGSANVIRYTGQNWIREVISSPGEKTNFQNIAINKLGQVYVAFIDYTDDLKLKVMTLTPTQGWQSVAPASLPRGSVDGISLALDNKGDPYVSYGNAWDKGSVIKSTSGGAWMPVGAFNFTPNYFMGVPSLAIDHNNTPYLTFYSLRGSDSMGESKIMKFNGKTWVDYGWPVGLKVSGYPIVAVTPTTKIYLSSINCDDACTISVMSNQG